MALQAQPGRELGQQLAQMALVDAVDEPVGAIQRVGAQHHHQRLGLAAPTHQQLTHRALRVLLVAQIRQQGRHRRGRVGCEARERHRRRGGGRAGQQHVEAVDNGQPDFIACRAAVGDHRRATFGQRLVAAQAFAAAIGQQLARPVARAQHHRHHAAQAAALAVDGRQQLALDAERRCQTGRRGEQQEQLAALQRRLQLVAPHVAGLQPVGVEEKVQPLALDQRLHLLDEGQQLGAVGMGVGEKHQPAGWRASRRVVERGRRRLGNRTWRGAHLDLQHGQGRWVEGGDSGGCG